MVAKTYSEAEKMRQVPGVTYMDGAVGRRAHLVGTGLDVWEIIQTYLQAGRSEAVIADVWEHMTPEQIHAALDFYALFPEEIDERLRLEAETWNELFGPDADV